MFISPTCCSVDSDGVSSSGRPPRSCAVAWAEPPADEGGEPLPLESRVSPSVFLWLLVSLEPELSGQSLLFGCCNVYIFILLFISSIFFEKNHESHSVLYFLC